MYHSEHGSKTVSMDHPNKRNRRKIIPANGIVISIGLVGPFISSGFVITGDVLDERPRVILVIIPVGRATRRCIVGV